MKRMINYDEVMEIFEMCIENDGSMHLDANQTRAIFCWVIGSEKLLHELAKDAGEILKTIDAKSQCDVT